MNTFAQAAHVSTNRTYTENGMAAFASSNDRVVDLFFQAGAMRGKDIIPMFSAAFAENKDLAIRTLLWLRDVRQGAGERKLFRDAFSWLEMNDYDSFRRVADRVGELGRWDDLLVAKTTKGFDLVATMIKHAIDSEFAVHGASTASKWVPRKGSVANQLRAAWGLTPKQYRKYLVRTTNVVETQMCAKEWDKIDFNTVPSVAMARYTKAFGKNAEQAFTDYKQKLSSGDAKVNASAVYPYDVLKTWDTGDRTLAEHQWNALPNYLTNGASILPMVDSSGSMTTYKAGNQTVLDVAVSIGLYIADKQTGPFSDLVLTFSTSPSFVSLQDKSFGQKIEAIKRSQWSQTTNLQAAYEKILEHALTHEVPQSDMPEYLLILSDMAFNQASHNSSTAFDIAEKLFALAGYKLPKLVFWNLNAKAGSTPVTKDQSGAALVSGFSPSIAKAIMAANTETFTPMNVMLQTVADPRYNY